MRSPLRRLLSRSPQETPPFVFQKRVQLHLKPKRIWFISVCCGRLRRAHVECVCRACLLRAQVPLLARDIQVLSVQKSLKCSELNDRLFLRSAITEKYRSVQAFERMVQASDRPNAPSDS